MTKATLLTIPPIMVVLSYEVTWPEPPWSALLRPLPSLRDAEGQRSQGR